MPRFGRPGDAAGVIDVVRLLHTPQIEHAALVWTLRIRALAVASAPLLGAVVGWLWVVATVWCAATAIVAGRLATAAMTADRVGLRRALLAVEVPLTLAVAVWFDAWPAVLVATGWINWVQRPHWRARHVVVWLGATLGALAIGGASPWQLAAAAALLALTSGSYGLMAPRVLIAAPRALRARRGDRSGSAAVVGARAGARPARPYVPIGRWQRVEVPVTPHERPATLGELVTQAVLTVVPRAGAPLTTAGVRFTPARLADRAADDPALEQAIKALVLLCAQQSEGQLVVEVELSPAGHLLIAPALIPPTALAIGPGTANRLERELAGRLRVRDDLAIEWPLP